MSPRRKWLLAYLGLVGLALTTAALRPVAFQKINSIRAGSPPPLAAGEALDVAAVVGAIPYREGAAWSVLPAEKYRMTIERGLGNCSQKTFGLAWRLDREAKPFQVVHMLPIDSFLRGGGHTVLRARIDWRDPEAIAIVDLRAGALPLSGDRPIDVADLAAGPIESFGFAQLNPGGEDSSRYYGPPLEQAVVGVIPGEEVSRYFRFLESVYVPLGSARLEKLGYDGLAMLLGFFPTIHVDDTARLLEGRALETAWSRGALWILRSALVIVPLFVLLELFARRARA